MKCLDFFPHMQNDEAAREATAGLLLHCLGEDPDGIRVADQAVDEYFTLYQAHENIPFQMGLLAGLLNTGAAVSGFLEEDVDFDGEAGSLVAQYSAMQIAAIILRWMKCNLVEDFVMVDPYDN